jgi:glycosyltransferase involved in cell wall biosynthesis
MKISFLINTRNQAAFLDRAIKSCIKQGVKDYEIIVSDLSIKKNFKIINKYKKKKNFFYISLKEQFAYPTQNQLYAIKKSLEICNGSYIFLLDGDDFFKKEKIKLITKEMRNKNKNFIMDTPLLLNEKNKDIKKITKINIFKNSILYKIFINKWPAITCTSCIAIKKKNLDTFFDSNPFAYKYLAIDIQLSIFFLLRSQFFLSKKELTIKSENNNNLDRKYSNIFKKEYWQRRMEQHYFFFKNNKKYTLFKGFDFYLTKIIFKLLITKNNNY